MRKFWNDFALQLLLFSFSLIGLVGATFACTFLCAEQQNPPSPPRPHDASPPFPQPRPQAIAWPTPGKNYPLKVPEEATTLEPANTGYGARLSPRDGATLARIFGALSSLSRKIHTKVKKFQPAPRQKSSTSQSIQLFCLHLEASLLRVELFCLQLRLLELFCLQLELFCLQWESAYKKPLNGL